MSYYRGYYQDCIDNHAYETEEELAELQVLRDEEWEDAMIEQYLEELYEYER